ncbi:endonuclease dU [Leptodesmis sp.]|uniref:endonuclease dU n=1 Tax=Leptodesmis sp. TaxID=3100501 RepID=UPI0040535A4B
MNLKTLLEQNRTIRVIGFDDAPFIRCANHPVPVAGVVCAGTRFEGMVWGQVTPDGWDATEVLCDLLLPSKFLAQVHLVLLDGISLAGFNIVNLPLLAEKLQRPCVTVMRRYPNMQAVEYAIRRLPNPEQRLALIQQAGLIYKDPPFYFQVSGSQPEIVAKALRRLTDCGNVPEALRVAHLITSAVVKGESGRQA